VAAPAKVVDTKKYGRLLARTHPSVIETEEENERILSEVKKLIDKGESRTPEEGRLLDLLLKLVEDFEEKHYPIQDALPHEILQELMRQHDLRQRDLVPLLGSSRGTASEVINGKRRISRTQVKALAERFNVSAELFL
jgi:HTH-type transcriptional regulator/antitoxin HigA